MPVIYASYAVMGVPLVAFLLVLWVLLAGQPAGQQANIDRLNAQATEITVGKATVAAYARTSATSTPFRRYPP